MATIVTGRTLTITVATVNYSAQVSSVSLTASQTVDQYITLTETTALAQPATWTLDLDAYQDWGAAGSFFDAMWAAAITGTAIAFEMGTAGDTFSGDIIPIYPTVGGAADSALTASLSLAVSGGVTKS